jgi:hypothetical protein
MNTFTILLLFGYVAVATSVILPELHVIKKVTFKHPYGCPSSPLSYEGTALFLTDYGVSRNAPDLLYYGACGGVASFKVMLAGDNFGMLTDIGDVPLETLTASKAFNYVNVVGKDNQFTEDIQVITGHTYAALLAKSDIRALFVFRVESYEPNGPATLSYAVKQYGVIQSVQEAPGFSWVTPNH